MRVKGGCCVLGACRASRFLAHYSAACRISSEASSAIRYQSQVREDATIVHRQVTMAAADVLNATWRYGLPAASLQAAVVTV